VARIQIPYTFGALSPESITVQWAGRRAQPQPAHDAGSATGVASGHEPATFVAADNVEERTFCPCCPAPTWPWAARLRTDPTNSSVAEARDDPAAMEFGGPSPGTPSTTSAEKTFSTPSSTRIPGTPIDYKTQAEPWPTTARLACTSFTCAVGSRPALREGGSQHRLLRRSPDGVRLI